MLIGNDDLLKDSSFLNVKVVFKCSFEIYFSTVSRDLRHILQFTCFNEEKSLSPMIRCLRIFIFYF